MTGKLQVTLCGAPTLTLGEQSLAGLVTGKALALLVYLAVTGRPHQRDVLAELLWSDLALPQARANLRYLLPDLRQLLGDYLLVTPQTIAFNRTMPYWLDVEAARTTLTAPRHTVSADEVQAALALLREEFLAGVQVRKAPAFRQWVAEQRQALATLRIQAQTMPSLVNHNLPNQLTPFLGREQEISEICHFLGRVDYRLLTIVGSGGVGKTRLALAIAQRILASCPPPFDKQKAQGVEPEFPDGIWFIPLVSLTVTANLADQLAAAIGKELGFTFSPQGSPTTQILRYLSTKRLLLIFDNFEQLYDEPGFIMALLQKTSGIKLLITSQRRLNIQAEYPWFITGLPIPPLSDLPRLTPTELLQFAGIALFVEHARRAQSGFQLSPDNQCAVGRICYAVAGLPLAIELAAALSREYTCATLAETLAQDYKILTTTLTDVTDRHRSIKKVIEYAWRFLRCEEIALLSRCAIFRGRFDQEAAAFVAAATPSVLIQLHDQSLLHWAGELSGRRYFMLHELVRHYALEQLTPLARQQVQEQHAGYFLTKLQVAESVMRQHGISQELLHCDLDNIRAAWEWAVAQKRLNLLAQGTDALAYFYRMSGLHQEAYAALRGAIDSVRQSTEIAGQRQLLARLLNRIVEFCRYLDRLEEAEMFVQEALQLGKASADPHLQGRSYHDLARNAQRCHHHMAMRRFSQQAQHYAQQAGDAHLQALCLNTCAVSEVLCGDLGAAIAYYQAALRHLQQSCDRELEATINANLGGAYKRNRDYTPAVEHLVHAVAVAQSINDHYGTAINLILLGNLWLELGAYASAQSALSQALRYFDKLNDPYWEAWGRTSQAHLWQLVGDPAAAAEECRRVLPLVQDKMPLLEHRVLTYLGDALCMLGELDSGEKLYWRSLAIQQEAKLNFRLTEPVIRLAHLLLARKEINAAQTLLEEPLAALMQQGPATVAEPFALYLISYHVFRATDNGRAEVILQQGCNMLQEAAAKIRESALRQSFLENVQPRRALLALERSNQGDKIG
jgi:predicted ATPase